jgi:hypothetical protein
MDEAKQVFVEHLKRTRPEVTVATEMRVTSTLSADKRVHSVSRLEISDEPLPVIRSQLLSRDADHPDSRFLLDQTIDLSSSNPDKTRIAFWVWDEQGQRARLMPIDPFMAFPGSSVRLLDHLLPIPELVTSWAIGPGAAGQDVITLGLFDPLPPALSPVWQEFRLHVGRADRRLHRAEVIFGGGSSHVAKVSAWESAGGINATKDVTITDGSQSTRTQLMKLELRPSWGAEKFTRPRLEIDNF